MKVSNKKLRKGEQKEKEEKLKKLIKELAKELPIRIKENWN